jgi:hypothetical protein
MRSDTTIDAESNAASDTQSQTVVGAATGLSAITVTDPGSDSPVTVVGTTPVNLLALPDPTAAEHPMPLLRSVATSRLAHIGDTAHLGHHDNKQHFIPGALANSPSATRAFVDFFAATLPNTNTRQAYMRDVTRFFDWCSASGYDPLTVSPLHLARYASCCARA